MNPRARKTERVVVVRTDTDGNILDYDVVEQPTRTITTYSPSLRQSPRISRNETFDEKEEEVENKDYDDEENRSISRGSSKKRREDSGARSLQGRRRVRYVRPKSTVKIFEEKVDWNADAKIDARNDEAVRRMHSGPKKKVFREKLDWRVKPRTDTHNEDAIENFRRSTSRPQIFFEKPNWSAEPKINTYNEEFIENHRRAPKQTPIYDEKYKWKADARIDSHNEEAIERLKSAPKPLIYDEKFTWSATPRIDNYNEEYLQHKEREKILLKEKPRIQSFPHERTVKADRPRVEHTNTEYEEYKKRQKSARLPPIEDRKLHWQKTPRINQRNDDYIERMRQKRSIPLIFREKVKWNTKTPKINDHNEQYVENLKDQTRPKILNQLPRWRSQAKIDHHNTSYDSNAHEKPTIISEKLRWHARPKIDTGLEPEFDQDEYDDDVVEDEGNNDRSTA